MWAMTTWEHQLLEEYRALGTPEEIRRKLCTPYPDSEAGYAPLPMEDDDRVSCGLLDENP